jgi:hypothetical protein
MLANANTKQNHPAHAAQIRHKTRQFKINLSLRCYLSGNQIYPTSGTMPISASDFKCFRDSLNTYNTVILNAPEEVTKIKRAFEQFDNHNSDSSSQPEQYGWQEQDLYLTLLACANFSSDQAKKFGPIQSAPHTDTTLLGQLLNKADDTKTKFILQITDPEPHYVMVEATKTSGNKITCTVYDSLSTETTATATATATVTADEAEENKKRKEAIEAALKKIADSTTATVISFANDEHKQKQIGPSCGMHAMYTLITGKRLTKNKKQQQAVARLFAAIRIQQFSIIQLKEKIAEIKDEPEQNDYLKWCENLLGILKNKITNQFAILQADLTQKNTLSSMEQAYKDTKRLSVKTTHFLNQNKTFIAMKSEERKSSLEKHTQHHSFVLSEEQLKTACKSNATKIDYSSTPPLVANKHSMLIYNASTEEKYKIKNGSPRKRGDCHKLKYLYQDDTFYEMTFRPVNQMQGGNNNQEKVYLKELDLQKNHDELLLAIAYQYALRQETRTTGHLQQDLFEEINTSNFNTSHWKLMGMSMQDAKELQTLYARVTLFENTQGSLTETHKELLSTWEQVKDASLKTLIVQYNQQRSGGSKKKALSALKNALYSLAAKYAKLAPQAISNSLDSDKKDDWQQYCKQHEDSLDKVSQFSNLYKILKNEENKKTYQVIGSEDKASITVLNEMNRLGNYQTTIAYTPTQTAGKTSIAKQYEHLILFAAIRKKREALFAITGAGKTQKEKELKEFCEKANAMFKNKNPNDFNKLDTLIINEIEESHQGIKGGDITDKVNILNDTEIAIIKAACKLYKEVQYLGKWYQHNATTGYENKTVSPPPTPETTLPPSDSEEEGDGNDDDNSSDNEENVIADKDVVERVLNELIKEIEKPEALLKIKIAKEKAKKLTKEAAEMKALNTQTKKNTQKNLLEKQRELEQKILSNTELIKTTQVISASLFFSKDKLLQQITKEKFETSIWKDKGCSTIEEAKKLQVLYARMKRLDEEQSIPTVSQDDKKRDGKEATQEPSSTWGNNTNNVFLEKIRERNNAVHSQWLEIKEEFDSMNPNQKIEALQTLQYTDENLRKASAAGYKKAFLN